MDQTKCGDKPRATCIATQKETQVKLEDYFDFLAPDDIRIKGHRIGIETILLQYLHRGQSPEQIAEMFDTLTLEQIYATILYYLHNKPAVEAYLSDYLEYTRQSRRAQELNPPPGVKRIKDLQAARKAEATVITG